MKFLARSRIYIPTRPPRLVGPKCASVNVAFCLPTSRRDFVEIVDVADAYARSPLPPRFVEQRIRANLEIIVKYPHDVLLPIFLSI